MAKKKSGKALFEVLGGSGKAKVGVPGWFGQAGPAQPGKPAIPPAPEPAPAPEQAPEPPPLPERRTPPVAWRPPGDEAPAGPAKAADPVISVSGGRLRISLNHVSAIVFIAALILLLFGAYQWGRHSTAAPAPRGAGGIDAPYKPSTTQPGTLGRAAVAPVPTPPAGGGPIARPGGMLPDDAPRQKGYSYLVIQGGIASRDEAVKIKKFLYGKGVNATVNRMQYTGNYWVKDMRGFINIRDPKVRQEIRAHVEQIERLGVMYQQAGGRRNFAQSHARAPWMVTER